MPSSPSEHTGNGGSVALPRGSTAPTAAFHWPVAAATAVGPMPGTDIRSAAAVVAGELPELPFLPQLPARGVGADAAGRAIALLVDIWADVVPSGWRISRRPTRDVRRGQDIWAWDLDAVVDVFAGAPVLKTQICGPWTLGALLELSSGHRAITDAGAMRDLTDSLREGIVTHLADLSARLPGTALILQIDEPELAAVVNGSLSTPSGFGTVGAVDPIVVRDGLAVVLDVPAAATVVNGGRSARAWELFADAGAGAVTLDLLDRGTTAADLDPIGVLLERGVMLLAAAVPATPSPKPVSLAEAAQPVTRPMRALGFPSSTVTAQIVPTVGGGLEDAPTDWPAQAFRRVRDLARLLADGDGNGTADGSEDGTGAGPSGRNGR